VSSIDVTFAGQPLFTLPIASPVHKLGLPDRRIFLAARVQPCKKAHNPLKCNCADKGEVVKVLTHTGDDSMADCVKGLVELGFDDDSISALGVPVELIERARDMKKAHHSRSQMREHGSGRFRRSLFRSANANAYRRIW
jgi:hypothetical protein